MSTKHCRVTNDYNMGQNSAKIQPKLIYIYIYIYYIMPPAVSAINEYRKRVKTSNCRFLGTKRCAQKPNCKYASGTMRRFCRKSKNTRRGYTPMSSRRNSSVRRSSSKSMSYATPKESKSLSFASAKSRKSR